MSTVTDAMILAAVRAFNRIPGLFPAMKGALEAAEAVRVKAEPIKGNYTVDLPRSFTITPTIPEGFIPWHGGECPVASGTMVKCMLVNEVINSLIDAINMRWSRIGSPGDIIAYRIHKPADFRLEAGKFYVTASGERVGPMRHSSGAYGSTYHDSDDWGRWWWPNGEIGFSGSRDPDLLALSSNQENNHD